MQSRSLRTAFFTAAAALAALAAAAPAAASSAAIEDDWPRALAEAKRLGVPILVDVWAPW